MISGILTKLNWVDFIVICIIIRILYVAAKNGVVVESFKLLGIIFTTYISLHYYINLSNYIAARFPGFQFPQDLLQFFVFIVLVTISYSIFVFARRLFCNLVKMEAVPMLSKWGGVFLGVGRGFLTAGLIVLLLLISTFPYLNTSVRKSYSGKYLFNTSVASYSAMWNGLMSKFLTNEKYNDSISKIKPFDSVRSTGKQAKHSS